MLQNPHDQSLQGSQVRALGNYLAGWLDLGGGTFTSILHMAPGTGPSGEVTDTKQARRPKSTGERSEAPQGRTLDGVLGCEVRRASHQEPRFSTR